MYQIMLENILNLNYNFAIWLHPVIPNKIATAKIRFIILPPNAIICRNFSVAYMQL